MRPVPPGWSAESLACGVRGHVAPAARAGVLGDGDRAIGVDQPDGTRLSRCLRCDAWIRTSSPEGDAVEYERVPPLASLPLPRRGAALDDAIVLRLIACERLLHVALFGLLGAVLLVVDLDLGGLRRDASAMAESLGDAVAGSSRAGGHSWLAERLDSVAGLQGETVRALMVAALLFAALEAVEAWGLWHERRWGEYLTVVATALFLPIEVHELTERVTLVRVALLALNVVVLVYLVLAKHLFGLRGGAGASHHDVDWGAVLAEPAPPVDEVVAR